MKDLTLEQITVVRDLLAAAERESGAGNLKGSGELVRAAHEIMDVADTGARRGQT